VREVFRNLATAQQTRCVVDADELLSVFPEGERADAEAVLKTLIDARLLTTYEAHATEPGQTAGRRVEVVHESLLTAWPRLVRWRTEDEGGAQLRDQLRQAAHLWEEKGKPDDLLWTGTSYQEYQVWRSRYPGGLSEVEEAFGRAMVAHAGRRRRQRRMAYAAAFAAVVLVASGLGFLLRKSVRETRRAENEARQHEAAKLLSLGRLRLGDHPNAALAYAIASLERSDNGPARRFAVEALWQGPAALFLPTPEATYSVAWSPDGRRLAVGGIGGAFLFDLESGKHQKFSSAFEEVVGLTSDGQRVVSYDDGAQPRMVLHVWALPDGRLERTLELGSPWFRFVDDSLLTFPPDASAPEPEKRRLVRRLSLDGSTQQELGRWQPHDLSRFTLDPTATWLFSLQGGRLFQQRLDALSAPPRVLGTHEGHVGLRVWPWRDRVVTGDSGGEVRIWDVPSARLERTLKSPADARLIALDPKGRFLATGPGDYGMPPRTMFLFDLAASRTAEPMPLLASELIWLNQLAFSPDGSWLASVHAGPVILWNMVGPRSNVLGRQKPPVVTVAFTPDGHLVSTSDEGVLRLWPLSPVAGEKMRELWSRPGAPLGAALEVDPGGRFVVVTDRWVGKVVVVPLDGSAVAIYEWKRLSGMTLWGGGAALDPSGRFLAVCVVSPGNPKANSMRILDLATGEERALDTHPRPEDRCCEKGSGAEGVAVPLWLSDGRLVSDGDGGLRLWDLATGTSRRLRPCRKELKAEDYRLAASIDSRAVVLLDAAARAGQTSTLSVFDLASGATREITSHGNRLGWFTLDASRTILVTGDEDGVVRVGPISGEEPRLLFGHTGPVLTAVVSPDGRWIASGSDDGTIRLWPMPDFSKPPLHTLPHGELLAKLRSLTNLCAVRDPSSDTGWRIEVGPLPGWATVPEWNP
jgi:WD40 repeat protein